MTSRIQYKDFMETNTMQLVHVRKLFPKIEVGDFWGVGALEPEPEEPEDPLFILGFSAFSNFFFLV